VPHPDAMRKMMRRHLTYKEAFAMTEISLWHRQRLADARREVYQQLLAVFGPVIASEARNYEYARR
jgi:hypothetical protein